LVSVIPAGSGDEARLLSIAASLERGSEHPLAAAILAGAEARGVEPVPVEDFESLTGRGVTGLIDGRRAALGNRALLESFGVDVGEHEAGAEARRAVGQTVLYAPLGDEVIGLLGGADPSKATSPDAVRALREEGLRLIIASGDNET